jgi:hypothetical protein
MVQFFRASLLALSLLAATPAMAQERTIIDVTARGIDDAITRLAGVPGNREAQQAALVLTLLRGFGKPAANGRLDYQIEVTKESQILINGVNISVILQAANRKP